jgi:DNA-binding transcriptional LysR family regulator
MLIIKSVKPDSIDCIESPLMDIQATQLSTIALFCKAAELGSFTQAAQALGLTPAAVSRGVGRLEERLGSKLFRRTTRSMQLTDDGRLYFEQCRAALAQIDDAELAITGR